MKLSISLPNVKCRCSHSFRNIDLSGGTEMSKEEWKWFGSAAHFICGDSCRFHLATLVGDYIVSTIGEWYTDKKQNHFGCVETNLYETMVFRAEGMCECGCGLPQHKGQEIHCERYETAKRATEGHMEYCLLMDETTRVIRQRENMNTKYYRAIFKDDFCGAKKGDIALVHSYEKPYWVVAQPIALCDIRVDECRLDVDSEPWINPEKTEEGGTEMSVQDEMFRTCDKCGNLIPMENICPMCGWNKDEGKDAEDDGI
jgi:hypothetical protein